jgi:hypothetical protein
VHYKDHEIVIRTTYEITIDGETFAAHVNVDNNGRVHYHGLPTRDFPSTVDLVKQVIDAFPDDFSGQQPPPAPDSETKSHGGTHDHEPGS